MDVERNIEFIVEMQAKQAAHLDAQAAHMDAIDRRMDGVTKLLQQGMQLLVNFQTETNQKINALVDAQLCTEEKLQRFIDRQGRNGH
jgi:hypothetical protein